MISFTRPSSCLIFAVSGKGSTGKGSTAREEGLGTRLEDCKLVVTCKMQNRNATDKLNQQCSKIALFANTINNANLLHCGFSLSVAFLFAFCK